MGETKKLVTEPISIFKKGLAFQRERFKAGKDGSGINNYDLMCDALENLKSDLKSKTIKKGNKNIIERVEKIIRWYRTKEERYVRNTPEGRQIVYPARLHLKIDKNLTIAYELLIEQMDLLELL